MNFGNVPQQTIPPVAKYFLSDATAAAPSLTFRSDPTLGFFKPAANQLAVSVSGTQAATFCASGVLLLGGATTNNTGTLQLASGTTSAGGIAFGTDWFEYRTSSSNLTIENTATQQPTLTLKGTDRSAILQLNGAANGFSMNHLSLLTDTALPTIIRIAASNDTLAGSIGANATQNGLIFGTGSSGTLALSLDNSQFLLKSTGANGQSLNIKHLTELTTIAAAATTDTTIQMPANSIVLSVSVRVTVVIPTAATFTVGDSGSAARFSTTTISTAANTTDPGTKAGAYYNASALSVRITPNLTPASNTGRVRVTIAYLDATPPTS